MHLHFYTLKTNVLDDEEARDENRDERDGNAMSVPQTSIAAHNDRAFDTLDAARGVAALIVALHHQWAIHGQLFASGYLAVDFFFALSGFVLAHAYGDRLVSGRMKAREFLVARVVRLYPLYLLGLLAVLIALSPALPWSLKAIVGKLPFALAMLPSPTYDAVGFLYPFNIPSWSIFFELLINLVMALFCLQLRDPRIRWAAIILAAVYLDVHVLMQGGSVDDSGVWNTLDLGFARVAFSFFVGMQLYEWHQQRAASNQPKLHSAWAALSLVVLVACLALPKRGWLELACILVVFPALIMVLAESRFSLGIAGVALRNLGIASYALYMLHIAFQMGYVSLLARHDLPPDHWPWAGVPLIGLIVAASWAADRWWDRPGRALMQSGLRRFASHRTGRKLAAQRAVPEADGGA